jgi:DNA-binding NarL/FixJ family response regulator
MIRLLIADDEALIRDGLRAIAETEHDIEVVGEARDGDEAVTLTAELKPDVALIDIRMPGVDGLQATRRILGAARPPKVIVLTTFDLNEYVYDAITAGASGFLLKDVRRVELIGAIRAVHSGGTLIAPAITRRLVERYCRTRPEDPDRTAPLAALTVREREVLQLVGLGRSNTEIAAQLFIAETTVKTHMARLLTKLGLRDRAQAVVIAYETGLVTPGDPGFAAPQDRRRPQIR